MNAKVNAWIKIIIDENNNEEDNIELFNNKNINILNLISKFNNNKNIEENCKKYIKEFGSLGNEFSIMHI